MKRLLVSAVICLATTSVFAAHLVIRNTNAPGVGLNDTTTATPIAGNAGTTVGQQRLNVFQRAADMWGALLDSKIDILVDASFTSLDCSPTSGILGQAYATKFARNFDNAPQQNVQYPVALANAIAGRDLIGGTAHIHAEFNSQVDSPSCLGGAGWYYGFDANHGAKEDLLVVVLHELGHGLGFAGVTDGTTGAMSSNLPSVFEQHMLDNTAGLHWSQMTNDQRITSSTNDQNVVWDGNSTTSAALKFLGPAPTIRIGAPVSIAKTYQINAAGFGSPITVTGLNGTIAATLPADGCSAITNGSAVIGRIALIDRGTCTFVTKANNAQLAGATAVIIANNTTGGIAPGDDGSGTVINIPVIGISQSEGADIRSALTATVSAFLFADPSRLAGADVRGHARLYVPLAFSDGSSMYHFDITALPNLLMEPNINSDLPSNSVDLTLNELIDIGWKQAASAQGGRYAGRRGH
jgi:hypothetical protein